MTWKRAPSTCLDSIKAVEKKYLIVAAGGIQPMPTVRRFDIV